jgi:hypothetical protein
MKKTIQSLLLIAAATSLVACNDKLKIAAPYKDITVVYGLLSKADTAHYIRIQKAYMDENQSAIEMAKVADSNFYKSLDVVIKEYTNSGSLVTTIPLKKVDLNLEGYAKKPGAFFETPNYAYKFKYPLNSEYTYRLVITNTETGNVDSSFTSIINDADSNAFGVIEWKNGAGQRIGFPRILRDNGKLDESNFSTNIPANVGIVELIVRFNWTDSNIVTKKSTRRFADFNGFSPASGKEYVPGDKNLLLVTQSKNYYDFLRSEMGLPSDANEYRYMDSVDMFLYVAGIEYQRYKTLNSNTGGLTADEIKPMYTNIKGKNVMGLFSTKAYVQKLQIPFSSDTKDSLQSNVITKDLNIRF